MLILSRKNEQTIVIDGRITITVLEVRGNVVRLGIDAPREVAVHRGEIHERIVADSTAGEHDASRSRDEPHDAANPWSTEALASFAVTCARLPGTERPIG